MELGTEQKISRYLLQFAIFVRFYAYFWILNNIWMFFLWEHGSVEAVTIELKIPSILTQNGSTRNQIFALNHKTANCLRLNYKMKYRIAQKMQRLMWENTKLGSSINKPMGKTSRAIIQVSKYLERLWLVECQHICFPFTAKN